MAGNARLDLIQHRNRRTDLAGGAVAALVAVMGDERRLQGVQAIGLAQPLNRGDLVVLMHDGERQAAVDAPAVDQHRASPALAMVAPLLAAGERQMLAQ